MRILRSALLVVLVFAGCTHVEYEDVIDDAPVPSADAGRDAAKKKKTDAGLGTADNEDAGPPDEVPPTNVRIVAANISSGSDQKYHDEGIRIFQGLHPDIALVQEFNYASNSEADIGSFVHTAFGADYTYQRELGHAIPNGVVTRYPILEGGQWTDPNVDNRSFVYAKIELPNQHVLWAVSVHLLTTGSANRNAQATELVSHLKSVAAAGDYIAIGGDFNTDSRTEACIGTFSAIVATGGPFPADQGGNGYTNAPRNHAYDWVLVAPALEALSSPTVIGGGSYAHGLVFDSQVYAPLADVAPVLAADSHVQGMQHMAIVRDFSVGL